jgi:hypothetical protein
VDYGQLLSRSWEIVWNNKFLIVLGMVVTLLGIGGGGANFNADNLLGGSAFGRTEGFNAEEFNPEYFGLSEAELEEAFGVLVPMLAAGMVAIVCIAFIARIALWVVGTIASGGLIAGVNEIETIGASGLQQAWNAGWQKGWRLLGISLFQFIALVPTVCVLAGFAGEHELDPTALIEALLCTICLVMLVWIVLDVLRILATCACMLEDTGVFESYRRGWTVLRDNLGEGLLLALIQTGISTAIYMAVIIPSLCCIPWPVLWAMTGVIGTFFSTAWTLAWNQWTGPAKEIVIEQAPSA